MLEWSSYQLSDLVLFSDRVYYRLFARYNEAVWPLPVLAVLVGLAMAVMIWRRPRWHGRALAVLLALAWLWVAWAYHHQRFAPLHWVADWYGVGFAMQALLMLWLGAVRDQMRVQGGAGLYVGLAVFVLAVAVMPWLAAGSGRDVMQAEVFAMAPDPTVIATLGLLVAMPARRVALLYVLPVIWCLISSGTLWVLASPLALLPVVVAVLMVAAALVLPRRA